MTQKEDSFFMARALELAREAFAAGEAPVGCVIVSSDGKILGEGRNKREGDCDPTAHAEIVALREAARKTGGWRLSGATLFVTCEPCPMCAGAMVLARIKRVVYGCRDPKGGGLHSSYGIGMDGRLNHTFEVAGGVMSEECASLLKEFFKELRA